ncbi:procollagen-lysine,2-oxoglutarate 5-dioxygenase 1-like isoform X3 [Hyalella azteca]|uniref:procollagen-lysine 5-dioxygenase n=2 Tax=Hyalella azteca TaxID=294128 RepID=A0A8B7NVL2_HYAAZ|nr:procollagen-lysine,2-oxoglutarate 5-dioxygenase 1-like isoform X3 [Hyalella azteca]
MNFGMLILALLAACVHGIEFSGSYSVVVTRPPIEIKEVAHIPPWGIGYYIPPKSTRMESGLPPEEEEEELKAKNEDGEYYVDAREQDLVVEDVRVGFDRGEEVGVGVQPGMLCVEDERPMGEDGINYCRRLTDEDKKRMERMSKNVVVLTVGSGESDAQTRLLRSAQVFQYTIQVLGDNQGPVADDLKLKLVQEAVAGVAKDHPDRLVLYLDGPDAILAAGPLRVVEEVTRDHEGPGGPVRVLLSADGVCWPDKSLAAKFPKLKVGRRFIDSGAFVGPAEHLHRIFTESAQGEKSLQELFTKLYLKDAVRKKYNIAIDHTNTLFQNLHGATGELELKFAGKEGYLQNTVYTTVPLVIRGNRNSKVMLNSYANYLARAWNPVDGCRECWENMLPIESLEASQFPVVTLAIFIPKPTPFLEEFFVKITAQKYPKERIHLYIHNMEEFHAPMVTEWVDSTGRLYKSLKYITHDAGAKEWHTKNKAIVHTLETGSDFLLVVDSMAHLDNPFAIKLLVEQNRKVVAPMLARPYKPWSNFWGALTSDGFYARSADYVEIVQNEKRGLWNVPFVGNAYMISSKLLADKQRVPSFINKLLEPDMAMCANLREKGVFIHVTNRLDMGHLVSADNFVTKHFRPEMWQLFENRWDWEARYLHENYSSSLVENATIAMPCPDVYWFPLFKERYAQDMIDVNENFGGWSDGSHYDKRLEGGYETVPTVDIHMNQIEYRYEWLEILRAYVQPLQLRVFEGYNNDPPQALMAFTVRYKPDEQPLLRPHHDTSTYTINVALNRPGIDFQGGGCRFVRYNCSVLDTRVGWVLMHPGRLTHLHEGLRVTEGTRYIVVTFVDP